MKKEINEKVKQEIGKSEGIIAAIGDGISIQDTDYIIVYQNKIHKKIFGKHEGEKCFKAYQLRDEICDGCPVDRALKDGKIHRVQWEYQTKKGAKYLEITASPLKDAKRNPIAGIEVVRDITTRKQTEEELEILATTDKLTGAYNRTKFKEIIEREIARVKRFNTKLSMIIFDIDHFKEVNDKYGHNFGDHVLKTLAHIVQDNIRRVDYFVRWGGEEFMIISSDTDIKKAHALAERIRIIIERKQFKNKRKVTVSFGVTEFKRSDTENSFIKRADDTMYRAKRKGRNRVEVSA
jgi:diguanylate cyclase (GGDEF)-like protein/PAS domain S-box-containing protein